MGKTRDLFKKIRDTKGTCTDGLNKGQKQSILFLTVLTEAEDSKKRWQEYPEDYTKKIFMTQIITMV